MKIWKHSPAYLPWQHRWCRFNLVCVRKKREQSQMRTELEDSCAFTDGGRQSFCVSVCVLLIKICTIVIHILFSSQEEEKMSKISVESRVRQDRELYLAFGNCKKINLLDKLIPAPSLLTMCINIYSFSGISWVIAVIFMCSFSLPRSKERLLVHVQPGTVLGIFLDLCQHDCSTFYSWSRFVKNMHT